ncbi:MAG: hypothetical protein H0V40_08480, partial [Actinobacteria bacterium]|nr:hypothetical protein [Actinomycetota bacterium]
MKKVLAVAAVLAAAIMVPVASAAENGKRTVGPAGYNTPGQGTLVLAGPSGAAAPVVGSGDHVVICHAIGGANGTDFIQIAPSAGVVFGHDGHEGDRDIIPPFVYEDNQGHQDRTLENGNNWTAAGIALYENGCAAPGQNPPPAPADLCPNLIGDQSGLPDGYDLDNGECVKVIRIEVPGPERVVIVERVVETMLPGPERVVERVVTVERIVTVPGPERVVERIVTVEKPAVAGATSSVVTRVVTKTKI